MAFFILIASSTFVFIKSNTNFNFTLPTPFYKNPFEFLVGFRSSFILIVALYMLMIISINVQNFGLGAFALFFLFFIIISFYQKPESVFYVWIYALNSKQFLIKKITIAIMHSFILTLPMLSGLIYFFPHYIAIIIAISLFGNILMITVLLSKYAQFPDALAPSKFLALIFSAWFPPLVIAFAIRFYLQSKKSLHTILK
ncbi:MAG: hypothetical protein HOO89_11695 [Ferruginibacter sp.]|nr:hypothetical protein [Ferruginibacter sp.]